MPDQSLPEEVMVPDLAALTQLATRLAAGLRAPDALLLEGELGAGKTALARAIIRALAKDPGMEVPSPTYSLVQSYATPRGAVHHFDLWRLEDPAELEELGFAEALDGIVLIEWPDRLGHWAPARALRIAITVASDWTRWLRLQREEA